MKRREAVEWSRSVAEEVEVAATVGVLVLGEAEAFWEMERARAWAKEWLVGLGLVGEVVLLVALLL